MTLVKVNNPYARSINGFVNDFFNEFPTNFGKTLREDVFGFPPVNIVEKADSYQVEIAVPGYDKADFNIKLEGNVLTVSAEKKEEAKDASNNVIRKEFTHKSFKRSFTIDEKIEDANINAKYENGILNITLPKKEAVKPASKDITIQ